LETGEQATRHLETAPCESDLPDARADQRRAMVRLQAVLEELDPGKREMFVMSEVEQMKGTEIAAVTGQNLNTIYARIKAARRAFTKAYRRRHPSPRGKQR
ncbi:MAG: sigma factor-like helix-turn-helix DNA-binding protein, partial [Myxococcota bacterium]